MFSGLLYCADCGEKLYYSVTNNYKREQAFLEGKNGIAFGYTDLTQLLLNLRYKSLWGTFLTEGAPTTAF